MIIASEVLVSLMVILFQHRLQCHACGDKSTGMSGMVRDNKDIAVNCSIHEAALADASRYDCQRVV